MTSTLFKYAITAILTINICNDIVFAADKTDPTPTTITTTTTTTAPMHNPSKRFLNHIFRKYGSHGTISFEGFEHLMHKLGIGGLDFPEKHTLDEHRPNGFKIPDISYDESTAHETTTTATHTTENDSLEKLINHFDNEQKEDIFRTMHDPNHRHPRHRDHSSSPTKSCLPPMSFIEMYMPDVLNGTQKINPIYRSSSATENAEHEHQHQHQHDHAHEHEHEHEHQHEHQHHHHSEDKNDDFELSNIQITPNAFLSMCPALLVQIEQGSCSEQYDTPAPTPTPAFASAPALPKPRKQINEISGFSWAAALVSITIISLCGLIGIAIVPLSKYSAYHEILRFMIAIAIGTLVGDALMHLIPHALMPHDHSGSHDDRDHHHDHAHEHSHAHAEDAHGHANESQAVWLCGFAFLTALIMYFIEALLPLFGGGHGHSHGGGGHSGHVGHSSPPQISNKVQSEVIEGRQPSEIQSSNCGSCEDLDNDIESSKKNNEEKVMVNANSKNKLNLTPVAFMVIIGDTLHNFTDGMAIGAAFGVDPVTGMATALAVLLHELPHELGDFALLLQTGVSLRRALMFNLLSSLLSFIGTIVGLIIVNANSGIERWIYAGTAGTFLYIAFADLVPELNRLEQSPKMIIIQAVGIALGGIIMLFIGLYEDNLRVLFE